MWHTSDIKMVHHRVRMCCVLGRGCLMLYLGELGTLTAIFVGINNSLVCPLVHQVWVYCLLGTTYFFLCAFRGSQVWYFGDKWWDESDRISWEASAWPDIIQEGGKNTATGEGEMRGVLPYIWFVWMISQIRVSFFNISYTIQYILTDWNIVYFAFTLFIFVKYELFVYNISVII